MIETQGLTHIHLMVRDFDRSIAFYKRAFGLEECFRGGHHMVFPNPPGSQDLITLNEDARETQLAGVNGGVNQFGCRLREGSDLGVAVKHVEAAGGAVVKRGQHAPGVPFAYIRDPDGYLIELLL